MGASKRMLNKTFKQEFKAAFCCLSIFMAPF